MKDRSIEIGKKYNSLTILKFVGKRRVQCQCDCGNITECDFFNLKGLVKIKGCGCKRSTEERRATLRNRAIELQKSGVFKSGGCADRFKDGLGNFRYLIRKCKAHSKNRGHEMPLDFTPENLHRLFLNQGEKCFYSKIPLNFDSQNILEQPSIDRTDSSKPYTLDNIKFIARGLNYAKRSYQEKYIYGFLATLTQKNDSNSPNDYLPTDSDFRFLLRKVKTRFGNNKIDVAISESDLKECWVKQSGKCPFTNVNLVFSKQGKGIPPYLSASVDRINSLLPYTKNNIQIVSVMTNYSKNSCSDSEYHNFIKKIRENLCQN